MYDLLVYKGSGQFSLKEGFGATERYCQSLGKQTLFT